MTECLLNAARYGSNDAWRNSANREYDRQTTLANHHWGGNGYSSKSDSVLPLIFKIEAIILVATLITCLILKWKKGN